MGKLSKWDEPIQIVQRLPFAIVEHAIIDDDRLSVYEKMAYVTLARFANNEGEMHPSYRSLAKRSGMSKSKIQEVIASLEAKGHINIKHGETIKPGDGEKGRKEVNRYVLTPGGVYRPGVHRVSPGGTPCVAPGYGTISNERDPMNKSFERFWTIYPRKVGKKDALRCWAARIKAGVDPEMMIACAEAYARAMDGREIEFVMHPKRFVGVNEAFRDYDPAVKKEKFVHVPRETPAAPKFDLEHYEKTGELKRAESTTEEVAQ